MAFHLISRLRGSKPVTSGVYFAFNQASGLSKATNGHLSLAQRQMIASAAFSSGQTGSDGTIIDSSTTNSSVSATDVKQKNQERKAKRDDAAFTHDALDSGITHPIIFKGSLFPEWCKAVAADTLKMAVNEAEAKMKSKAGVIGRAEGGELGMKLNSGYVSSHFVTDQIAQTCELEDPLVLIHEKKIYSADAVDKLLDLALNKQRSLLLVAEDIVGDALGNIILKKLSSGMKVCAIKSPGFGDNRKASLQNLASITGGDVITQELGIELESVEVSMLGTCKKVVISKSDSVIFEGAGDKKPTKEKTAEEKDIELVKMHSTESEFLLKHLLEEEENLERRQADRLNIIFKKFIHQFPAKKRRRSTKQNLQKS